LLLEAVEGVINLNSFSLIPEHVCGESLTEFVAGLVTIKGIREHDVDEVSLADFL